MGNPDQIQLMRYLFSAETSALCGRFGLEITKPVFSVIDGQSSVAGRPLSTLAFPPLFATLCDLPSPMGRFFFGGRRALPTISPGRFFRPTS